jgi:vacuolar-type H+-ATPase subunit I/STV1
MEPVIFNDGEMEGAVERLVTMQNGHNKTIQDVMDLLLAIHHDSKSRDNQIVEYLRSSGSAMEDYVTRIKSLEHSQSKCSDKVSKLIEEEHGRIITEHKDFHDEHMESHHVSPNRRADDDVEEDHSEEREDDTTILGEIKYSYNLLKWFLAAVAGVAITVGIVEFVEHVLH